MSEPANRSNTLDRRKARWVGRVSRKRTASFSDGFAFFRAPDLVSRHNSASAVYQSVSQLKMAFVLQSEQTGAGWPVAVIPGRQQEALFLLMLITVMRNLANELGCLSLG